ncbi:16S rRNA (cytosine(967)-C(5))-methyltransferase RsmB [Myxococcota bacterium]|nr:16S rRNA (cytosine(967)-C(5))-methyltransferase RsmB [Myxococcota bacterium]
MAATPGRLAAVRVLLELLTRGGHADALLDAECGGMPHRERALAVALVQGVERRRARYDHVLSPHSRRAPEALDPAVRVVLWVSVHQIVELSRIPERAVLHQAGELCRAASATRAVGFVTGALRSWLREPGRAPLPEVGREAIVVTESFPPWLADAWIDLLGVDEALEAARAFNQAPPLTLRVQVARASRERVLSRLEEAGIPSLPGRWSPEAVRAGAGDPVRLPGWEDGWFTVQDEGAQVVGALLEAGRGERVLDLCAAPGGKALQAAAAVGPGGEVVAADVDGGRLERIAEAARRLGVAQVRTVVHDALRVFPEPPFPRVLLDAPCTGLGVLRRHPEARWQRTPGDLARHSAEQAKMLEAAAGAVAPGGRLVYAVCSPMPAEGEAVVQRFLAAHAGWVRVAAGPPEMRTAAGDLRTWPHRHDTDAFFASVLERRGEDRSPWHASC